MLKMILRPLMLLVIVYGLGGYVFYLGTGQFPFPGVLFSSSTNDRPDLRRLSKMPQLNSMDADQTEDETIYKWQDESGVWHISNQAPEDGEAISSEP